LGSLSDTSTTVYTATFTPTADGAATIDVAASAFTDAYGNNNTAAEQFNWTYDGTRPTMTITATNGSNAVSDGSTTNDGTLTVTFTSSKATTDFAEGDISVDNGDLSDFSSTSSTVYTVTFTPTADGAATIDVEAAGFADYAGNDNTAAAQFNWTYDNTGPTMIGIIVDGVGVDIDWTNSTSSLTATWSGFSDTLSGIQKYEYAIGSSSGGTDVVDWTNNTTDTSVTKAGLTLTNGTVYYISIKATDNAENESTTITSNGVIVDTDGPIAGTVLDGPGADIDWTNSTSSLTATWSGFSDTLSGIQKYEYAIGSSSGGTAVVDWTNNTTDTSVPRLG